MSRAGCRQRGRGDDGDENIRMHTLQLGLGYIRMSPRIPTLHSSVRDEHVAELRRLYLQHEGIALCPEDAHEMLSRMIVLVERFSVWANQEAKEGRVFEFPEHWPEP